MHAVVAKEDPSIHRNTEAPRDFLNIGVGVAWQLTLVTLPLYVIFRDLRGTVISVIVLVSSMIFLKKFWYDRLETGEGLAQGTATIPAHQPAEVVGD